MNLRNYFYKVKNPRRCKMFAIEDFKLVMFTYDKLWQFRENLRRILYAQETPT